MAGRQAPIPGEPLAGEPPAAGDGEPIRGMKLDDRYEVLGLLGQGGMARVYRARDRRLDRLVALKVLNDAGDDAETTLAREDRMTAALAHPNIVTVYDSGMMPDGRPYLVLELLAGQPASHLAPLPTGAALAVAEQVAAALAHAHARGIVHCDVKPQNVLIDRAGRATLTDFGVASATTTPTGEAVYGAAAFLAPERLCGAAASPAVDLYALGATLYFLLAGRPPYVGGDDVVARVLAGQATPLEFRPGLAARCGNPGAAGAGNRPRRPVPRRRRDAAGARRRP